MKTNISIESGTLVVLSGLPGAGKSRLKSHAVGLPEGAWVSTDDLRRQILGNLRDSENGRPLVRVRQDANDTVFSVMRSIVQERLRQGLTVVLDATSVNDAERRPWVELADELGAPCEVLIVDTSLEQCLINMGQRQDWVPEARIREMHQPPEPVLPAHVVEAALKKGKKPEVTMPTGFERKSVFNHRLIDSDAVLSFIPRALLCEKCDVVGDVHGLYDDLLVLLAKAGWNLVDGRLKHADPERRLLFLGDLVDRGTQSIEVLALVMQAVSAGSAQCLLGNHESKLIKFIDTAQKHGIETWSSYANAETGMKMLALPEARRTEMMNFMKRLPACITYEPAKVAFVHADMWRLDPHLSLKGDMAYGQSGWTRADSDKLYEENFAAGLNEYLLVRGHIPNTSQQAHVISLDKHAFQKGELMLMPLDAFLKGVREGSSTQDAAARCILTQKCEFDFDAYSADRFKLIRAMERLVEHKLAVRYYDDTKMLRGYKYSREVFWNASWGEDDWLLKARGVVVDPAGNIVSHPFDKVFNFQEQGAGKDLTDDTPIVAPLKLNGFLGIVSAHPLKKGELLVHTQGGMGGPFTDYIKSFLDAKTKGLLCKYLAHRPMTLMFEVLHPEDPHIIDHGPEMMGLHLIGARGLKLEDQVVTEAELDEIGEALQLRRPGWTRTTWGAVKAESRTVRHEGWMVRADTAQQEYILKLKTPFYLTAKFLGRLSDKKVKHMYGSPRDFKKHVDEELYPLVDAVTQRFTVSEFLDMSDEVRVPKIRDLINELQ